MILLVRARGAVALIVSALAVGALSALVAAFVVAGGTGLVACGGPSFRGGVYRRGDVAFRVPPVPPRWERLEVENAALAFRDRHDGASILLNGRCRNVEDAPLVALTNQLLAGTTEREYLLEETIPFDGREARHTRLRAKLDGVLMAYDVYVMKKDGCVYDFVYVTRPGAFEEGVGEFTSFVQGFHTVSDGPDPERRSS